jgi:hypothetical protein
MCLKARTFGRSVVLRSPAHRVCSAGVSLSSVRAACVLPFGTWIRGPADLVAT